MRYRNCHIVKPSPAKGICWAIVLVVIFWIMLFKLTGCATYPEMSTLVHVMVQERYDAEEVCTELRGRKTLECVIPDNPCRIIINPYRANDDLEALGHEFAHCLRGDWHPDYKPMGVDWSDKPNGSITTRSMTK